MADPVAGPISFPLPPTCPFDPSSCVSSATLELVTAPADARAAHPPPDTSARDHENLADPNSPTPSTTSSPTSSTRKPTPKPAAGTATPPATPKP
jgi:hypothetical protein